MFPDFPTMKDKWSLTAIDKACIDGTSALRKKTL